MSSDESLYSILGVEPRATADEITEKYRILAREYHPDLNPTHHDIALFIRLRRAYEILKNKKSREEYDKTIGIYHAKENASVFLKETSHRIMRDKLEGLDDIDDSEVEPNPFYHQNENDFETENFFSKLAKIFHLDKKKRAPQTFEKVQVTKNQPLRKRNYQFSINILESILGTERIIVLNEVNGEQNSIKVKIPSGISDNSTLNVFHPLKGTIPIKISLLKHDHLSRNKLDVFLTLPFSDEELKHPQICEFYTCKGKVKITIPVNTSKPLRVKGHGLRDTKKNQIGDFYIQPKNGGSKAPVERITILKLLEPLSQTE